MKRAFSVLLAFALATPISSAAVALSTSSSGTIASPIVDTASTFEHDARVKKCKWWCVQSKLPAAEIGAFFVNENKDLVSVNESFVTLRNLDTRKITVTENTPTGYYFVQALPSPDRDEMFLVANSDSSGTRVYRMDTTTLSLTNVTPSSPTHPLSNSEFLVLRDDGGFLAVTTDSGSEYLCHFSRSGVEVGCSTNYAGSGQAMSHLFLHYSGYIVYQVAAVNKLVKFDVTDMSFTQTTIPGIDVAWMRSAADQYVARIYLVEDLQPGGDSRIKIFEIQTDPAALFGEYEISGNVSVRDAEVVNLSLFVIGQPTKSSGGAEKYSNVYRFDIGEDIDADNTIRIPNDKRTNQAVFTLAIDEYHRYVLASGRFATFVVPSPDIRITNTAEYNSCPTDHWIVTWDFLNLQPTKPVKFYDIYTLGSAVDDPWSKVGSVEAGGEHTFDVTTASVGDYVKVIPRGIKGAGYYGNELTNTPPIVAPGERQPRC